MLSRKARAVSQRPNLNKQHAFLLRLYFGADDQGNDWFISRAYRDMNRTLHGLSKMENAKGLVETAKKGLRNSLLELQRQSAPTNHRELARPIRESAVVESD
jgi:hypothetical protein